MAVDKKMYSFISEMVRFDGKKKKVSEVKKLSDEWIEDFIAKNQIRYDAWCKEKEDEIQRKHSHDWKYMLKEWANSLKDGSVEERIKEYVRCSGKDEKFSLLFLVGYYDDCFMRDEEKMTIAQAKKCIGYISDLARYGKEHYGDGFERYIAA